MAAWEAASAQAEEGITDLVQDALHQDFGAKD
jgi:hypothetical protein